MATETISAPAMPPEPPVTAATLARERAESDATRLLCAGTYLDPVYRKSVIRELLTHRFRVVAPSYGYDAVAVLAHALAARRLRRSQLWTTAIGLVAIFFLVDAGVLNPVVGLPAELWLLWAAAYLRRIATLQTLVTRLQRGKDAGGFDGQHPESRLLTDELVGKIDHEQSSGGNLVFYGGYQPFVGAGEPVRRWSNAELLLGAPHNVFEQAESDRIGPKDEADPQAPERKDVIPFTVEEITSYVADRIAAELQDDARPEERIEGLTVERRKFTTAVRTKDGLWWGRPPSAQDNHWADTYDAAREYLCVRVGSWKQELVTSAFIGFDLKGNTLHTEFYGYVLAPITESFHLVDRLPAKLGGGLLVRVAWDVLRGTPRAVLRLVGAPLRRWVPRLMPWRNTRIRVLQPVDTSEFRLGRYALTALNCGALTSVREMATSSEFHHFFQETDTIKYTQIVERHLFQIVLDFLREHDVDLAEHEARQTNILNNDYGHHNNYGPGDQNNSNSGTQDFRKNSNVNREAGR